MTFQTVIFHKSTGTILKVMTGAYISSRAALLPHIGSTPLKEVAFFYEPSEIQISQTEDHIKQISRGTPPVIVSSNGEVKSFTAWAKYRRNQISSAKNVLVSLEGGMGDQILQAEAITQFYSIFPAVNLVPLARPHYAQVLKNITGLKNIITSKELPSSFTPDFLINTHTQYISDPRGGLHGKASLYGACLGLLSVHNKVTLEIPPSTLSLPRHRSLHAALNTTPLRVGIHIRSGSGHAKSWNTEPAERLAGLFIERDKAHVFLLGMSHDWQTTDPHTTRIDQNYTWLESAALIKQLDLLVCIDSGPMHLARALNTPHLILWGGTSYRDILGREAEPHDMRVSLPCINDICYDCPNGIPTCMAQHSVDEIYYRGKLIVAASRNPNTLNTHILHPAGPIPTPQT